MLQTKEFKKYDREHPEVWAAFKRYAEAAREAGVNKFGAKAIMERVRWHVRIEQRRDDYKVNNNWTAFFVRKLEEEQPAFKGFFWKRESWADEGKTLTERFAHRN